MRFFRFNWTILFFLLLAAFTIFIAPLRNFISGGIFLFLRPVLLYGSLGKESINSFSAYFNSIALLEKNIKELTAENLTLKERIIDYEILREENSAFKKIISAFPKKTKDMLQTRIIGRSFDTGGSSLIINGGAKDGIVKGALVITGDRYLLGRISVVSENISTVAMLRNIGTALNVAITPRENNSTTTSRAKTEGLFIGYGNSMAVDLAPNAADIKVGDILTTNDYSEAGIPELIVGEVVSAQRNPAKLFQDILVGEIVPLQLMRTVFVVR